MKQESFIVRPIGIVRSPFVEANDTPIQPAVAGGAEGTVEVYDEFAAGLEDLSGFERIWLLCWLDRTCEVKLKVVPFRDTQERGRFSTRAPCRPNPIGLSPVRLLGIEGSTLRIADLDLLDGTPVLDIKPYAPRFDVFDVTRSGWIDKNAADRTTADNRFTCRGHNRSRDE